MGPWDVLSRLLFVLFPKLNTRRTLLGTRTFALAKAFWTRFSEYEVFLGTL